MVSYCENGFSSKWEQQYRANKHISVWPWSDLVSYTIRYSMPRGKDFKVLELGCGPGTNIPFFLSLGVDYYAIDESKTIIEKLKKKYPQIKNNLVIDDFTKKISFQSKFDLVVDRASLSCNLTSDISVCLKQVFKKLKNNGRIIAIDLYSTQHSEYKNGEKTEDVYTRTNYKKGQFSHLGKIHFYDKDHLLNLFGEFKILVLEHKVIKTEIPNEEKVFASWNLVAQKIE